MCLDGRQVLPESCLVLGAECNVSPGSGKLVQCNRKYIKRVCGMLE